MKPGRVDTATPREAYMKGILGSFGFEIKTISLKSEAHPVASAGMEGFMGLVLELKC
jgi:hypothetical protein